MCVCGGGVGSMLSEITSELRRPQDEKPLKLSEEGRRSAFRGGGGDMTPAAPSAQMSSWKLGEVRAPFPSSSL